MLKSLFQLFRKPKQPDCPMARDLVSRLSGVPDESATGRAILSTEIAMARATDMVGSELLNESATTKAVGTYFFTGVAIGYCHTWGASGPDDIRAVIRCAIRTWINQGTADHLANKLDYFLEEDDFSRAVIEAGTDAVKAYPNAADEIAKRLYRALMELRTFDVNAYYGEEGEAQSA